jgi:hypothetical protein
MPGKIKKKSVIYYVDIAINDYKNKAITLFVSYKSCHRTEKFKLSFKVNWFFILNKPIINYA